MSLLKSLSFKAPAKINLYLEIKGLRDDGYHNIESVMQTVTLFDTLTLTKNADVGEKITVECNNADVPCDERNLCYRAAKLFFESAGIMSYDITLNIDKQIPIAAGLGGGSSDAAATLLMLHRLYNSPLDESALYKIASKIGADVPFCMKKGISTTHGIGDVFSPCERLPECYFVIACAGEGVSTPWAYKRLDEMYDFSSREVSSNEFTEALKGGELLEIAGKMRNIFESAVLPERVMAQKIRDMLIDGGAINAMMSGSGPSVFGVFDKEEAANEAADQLLASGIAAHICKPYYPA